MTHRDKIDHEILADFAAENAKGGGKGRNSPETQRKLRRLADKALKAIQARDSKGFEKELTLAGIQPGSEPWKKAWKLFHSS